MTMCNTGKYCTLRLLENTIGRIHSITVYTVVIGRLTFICHWKVEFTNICTSNNSYQWLCSISTLFVSLVLSFWGCYSWSFHAGVHSVSCWCGLCFMLVCTLFHVGVDSVSQVLVGQLLLKLLTVYY